MTDDNNEARTLCDQWTRYVQHADLGVYLLDDLLNGPEPTAAALTHAKFTNDTLTIIAEHLAILIVRLQQLKDEGSMDEATEQEMIALDDRYSRLIERWEPLSDRLESHHVWHGQGRS